MHDQDKGKLNSKMDHHCTDDTADQDPIPILIKLSFFLSPTLLLLHPHEQTTITTHSHLKDQRQSTRPQRKGICEWGTTDDDLGGGGKRKGKVGKWCEQMKNKNPGPGGKKKGRGSYIVCSLLFFKDDMN